MVDLIPLLHLRSVTHSQCLPTNIPFCFRLIPLTKPCHTRTLTHVVPYRTLTHTEMSVYTHVPQQCLYFHRHIDGGFLDFRRLVRETPLTVKPNNTTQTQTEVCRHSTCCSNRDSHFQFVDYVIHLKFYQDDNLIINN